MIVNSFISPIMFPFLHIACMNVPKWTAATANEKLWICIITGKMEKYSQSVAYIEHCTHMRSLNRLLGCYFIQSSLKFSDLSQIYSENLYGPHVLPFCITVLLVAWTTMPQLTVIQYKGGWLSVKTTQRQLIISVLTPKM